MSIQQLDDFKAETEKLHEKFRNEGRSAIGGAFAEVFAAWPEAQRISWCQYTPYFNDGDPCVFRARDLRIALANHDEIEFYLGYDGELIVPSHAGLSPELVALLRKVWPIDDALLLAVFGDHTAVTVTRTEVTTTEYEHD